jgi:uncharacterized membrane protein
MTTTVFWGYGAALVVVGVLDALWLGVLARDFYRAELGALMAEQVRWVPALVFYFGYPAGLVTLALSPLPETLGAAVLRSALLGLIAYGVYDMTNLATLKGFGVRLALTDLAWGTFVTACAGAAAFSAMRWAARG